MLMDHQWMLNLVGESLMIKKKFINIVSIYFHINYLLIRKGKIVTWQWRKLMNATLTNRSMLTLLVFGQADIMCLLNWCTEKSKITFLCFSHQTWITCSKHEDLSDKLKLRDILQNKWAQKCQDQERLKYCPRLKETKETWQHVIFNWMLDWENKNWMETIKNIIGTINKI